MKFFKLSASLLVIAIVLSLTIAASAQGRDRDRGGRDRGDRDGGRDRDNHHGGRGGDRDRDWGRGRGRGGNWGRDRDHHHGGRHGGRRGYGGYGPAVVPVPVPVGGGAYGASCNQVNAAYCSNYNLGAICPAQSFTYSCVCYNDGTCATLSGVNACYQCQQDRSVVSVLDGASCRAC